ncbi:MAG: hypothetical protein AAGA44_00255 [Pseudomonadota bacterium]
MFRVFSILLSTLALSACGVLSAPVSLVEDRLQRNDDVYNRYGLDLDRVTIGDARQTAHDYWGVPRTTQPSYTDFDVYLGIRNSAGDWRVLPGDYNDLKRTTPVIVQVNYVDDYVNAIFLFGQDAFGNRRAWCDDSSHCAELFPYHVAGDDDAPANPLVVTVRDPGFEQASPLDRQHCELVVFATTGKQGWDRRLNFFELVIGERSAGFLSPGAYHVSRHTAGTVDLTVWPNFDYRGDIQREARESWRNSQSVDCQAGARFFVEVIPESGGLFTLDPGLRLSMRDEAAAVAALAVKRAIVPTTPPAPAVAPPLQGTAHLSR